VGNVLFVIRLFFVPHAFPFLVLAMARVLKRRSAAFVADLDRKSVKATTYSTSARAALRPTMSAPRSLPSVPLLLYGLLV